MALPLLTSTDWPAVRALLRVGLDSTALSDDTIAQDPFYPSAEREVVAAYPDAATTEDADALTHLRAAARYLTAANLAGSAALPQSEQFPDGYRYQLPAENWAAREATLRARAADALAVVTDPDGTKAVPTLFTVACGARGRA